MPTHRTGSGQSNLFGKAASGDLGVNNGAGESGRVPVILQFGKASGWFMNYEGRLAIVCQQESL